MYFTLQRHRSEEPVVPTQTEMSRAAALSSVARGVPVEERSPGDAPPAGLGDRQAIGLISVIIVNFNGGELLTECVKNVLASTVPLELLISDNQSTDGSVVFLRKTVGNDPRVRIVENGGNLGFARANNRMLDGASGEFLLFLNPDCLVQPQTLAEMQAVMASHPEAGMAGGLVRNLDGSEQAGCRRSIPTPWRAFVRTTGLSRALKDYPRFQSFIMSSLPLPADPVSVEAISGSFMFVRRAALEDVGPMDEGYFLHCEDLDWCMRFRLRGWHILFAPHTEVIHAKGVCSRGRPIRVLWHMHKGMVRFYQKFFRRRYPLPVMLLVVAGIWARFSTLAAITFIRRGKS